jgi:hypothetical protein
MPQLELKVGYMRRDRELQILIQEGKKKKVVSRNYRLTKSKNCEARGSWITNVPERCDRAIAHCCGAIARLDFQPSFRRMRSMTQGFKPLAGYCDWCNIWVSLLPTNHSGAGTGAHWCQLKLRRMEASCYKNQVRLHKLTENQGFWNLLPAGFVYVAAVLTAKQTLSWHRWRRHRPYHPLPIFKLGPHAFWVQRTDENPSSPSPQPLFSD